MKTFKLLIVFIIAISFYGCSNAKGNKENEGEKASIETSSIKPEHLTYESFKKKVWNFDQNPTKWVYEGTEPCVIDFYADWCGPCRRVAPIMEEMAQKYNGKVKIYKVNVDKEQKLAAIFGINSIPAVLFSPMTGKPMMQVGLLPHDSYVKIIDQHLLTKETENN